MKRVIAERGYDAVRIRGALHHQGMIPVIRGRRNRERTILHDERGLQRYMARCQVEAMVCRLKDFLTTTTR